VDSLILVTGPPGSGKSSVAASLVDRFDPSVLIAGDAFFAFLASGAVPPWLPESRDQNEVVVNAAAAATGAFVRGGYLTVYEGVIGPWLLPKFLESAGLVALDYALLLPSVETCVERVATRSGHVFTDESATRKMHEEFAIREVPTRCVLVTDGLTVDETVHDLLQRRERGRLRWGPTSSDSSVE